jgi:hypothetical protein
MPRPSWTTERPRQYQHLRQATALGSHHTTNGTNDGGRTYDDLYEEAKRRNIKGRSKMSKTELQRALG